VFFGIATADLAVALARSSATASLVLGVIAWLAGLGAVVLIFSKESRPFYRPGGAATGRAG